MAIALPLHLGPLYQARRRLRRFLPDDALVDSEDPVSHEMSEDIEVSEIAVLEEELGLIDSARKSKTRAIQLVRFLADFVVEEDHEAFETLTVSCECGESHLIYRAAWLIPLRDRKWIPAEDSQRANNISAQSLAALLGGEEDVVSRLAGERGDRLLRALGVSPPNFQLRVIAKDEVTQKALVLSIGDLTRAAGGSVERVQALVSEIRDHPEILDAIEENRAQRAKIQKNQRLGSLVEELLQEALQSKGLTVRRTGMGSDFEVESDVIEGEQEIGLEVVGPHRSILIEVKSTKADHVRMTPAQAGQARKEPNRFALCVVPLEDDSPTASQVREGCRFVFDIGDLLEPRWRDYLDVREVTDAARGQPGPVEFEITEGQVRFRVDQALWANGLRLDDAVAKIAGVTQTG